VIYRDDQMMLEAFKERLIELAGAGDSEAVQTLLTPLAGRAVDASLWRQILQVAAEHPRVLAPLLAEPLASPAILGAMNTNGAAAAALDACFPFLGERERESVEAAILALAVEDEWDQHRRDRVLLALPHELLVTVAVREQQAQAGSRHEARERRERETYERAVDEHRQHAARSAQSDPEDAILSKLIGRVQIAQPSTEAVDWDELAQAMRELKAHLDGSNGASQLRSEAGGWLTHAAVATATRTPLPADEATRVAGEVLLAASNDPRPHQEEDPDSFDKFPTGEFPSGRTDAARGLLGLARDPDLLPDGGLAAIERMANDVAAAVRLPVAENLHLLAASDEQLAWRLAETMTADPRAAVRLALQRSLASLCARDRERALDLVLAVCRAEAAREQPNEGVLEHFSRLLLESWVWEGTSQGKAMLDEFLADLPRYAHAAARLPGALRAPTTHGEIGANDLEADAVRARAIDAFARLAQAGLASLATSWDAYRDAAAKGEPLDEKRLKAAGEVVDHCCMELYFASGAYRDGQHKISDAKRRRFYGEAHVLIDALCEAPIPHAAHRVMETLEASIEFDPRGVLIRSGRLMQAAHDWQYDTDSQALSLFVNMTQRYLAEHRELLADAECRTSLLRSLELFVMAGWPAARRLIYRLDEAFR
jgi:hypothetical protein